MKSLHSYLSVITLTVMLLSHYCAVAQEAVVSNDNRQKVVFVNRQHQITSSITNAGEAVNYSQTTTKEADFQLYSFPTKGKTYLSVSSAIPNQIVKVLVYDVSGKIIYNNEELTNSNGEFVLQINPRYDYVPGECFIAALYNGQAFYETLLLPKQ